MKVVIFEGLDGAGKTTLFKAFEKNNEHYYACFDRWPSISSYVYDKYMARWQDYPLRRYYLDDLLFRTAERFGVLVVHVDTPVLTCMERRKDEESYSYRDWELQHTFYHEAMARIEKQGIPVLTVDGEESIPRLVDRVATKIGELRKETTWTTIR